MKLTDSPEEIRKGYQHMMRRINQLIFYMFVWLVVCLVIFVLFGHTESGAILLLVVGGIPELVLLLRLSLAARCPHCGTLVWLQIKWNSSDTVCPGCGVNWKTGYKETRRAGRKL